MQFHFTFEGNLAEDPELRFTEQGKAVAKLRVGRTTRRRNRDGEWVDGSTMWINVTAWEALAERAADLRKGDTVVIEARDDLSVWAYTRQDNNAPAGQLQVTANNIALSMRFKGAQTVQATQHAADSDDRWAGIDATAAQELEPAA